jgi:hypothetical protein
MTSKILNQKLLTPSKESPDHVFFRKTNLIMVPPVKHINDPKNDHDNDDSNPPPLGRQIMYEPVLVMTPVLASQRIHNDQNNPNKKKHLITADDVDVLTAQLDVMLSISGGSTNKEEEKQGDEEEDYGTITQHKDKTTGSLLGPLQAMVKRVLFATGDQKTTSTTTTTTTLNEEDKKFGRYEDTVFSYKANSDVSVKRSSRVSNNLW